MHFAVGAELGILCEAGTGAAESLAAGAVHLFPPECATRHCSRHVKFALGEVVQIHQASVFRNWEKDVSKHDKIKWTIMALYC